MTEAAFLQYTGYVLAFFAVWIVVRCARSMLSEKYVPEVWGYLELPDGTSRAIEHWECILGRAKASDIVLTGEGIERSHAAIQRSGAGEWTLSALDGGKGVWVNGEAVTGDAPLHSGDTIKLGEMELHFLALDDAQRATLQRKRPVTGHKVQPAVTLLLLVCFQLVLLFQFFFTTHGTALAYVVLSFGLLFAMEWFCYFVMRSISVRGFEPETIAFFLTSIGFSVVGSSAPESIASVRRAPPVSRASSCLRCARASRQTCVNVRPPSSPFSTERLISFSTCSVSSLKLFFTWFICNNFMAPLLTGSSSCASLPGP